MKKPVQAIWVAGIAALLVAVGACSSTEDGISSTFGGSGTGSLTVNIHDQAGPISAATVEFGALSLHMTDPEDQWVDFPSGLTVDLAQLIPPAQAELVTSEPIPAGTYDAMTMTLVSAQVTLSGGATVVVNPPAGPVEISNFSLTVEEGDNVVVTLDFPMGSFVVNGNQVTLAAQPVVLESIN